MTIDRYTCSCFSTDRLFESNSVKKRFLQLIGKRECPMKSVVWAACVACVAVLPQRLDGPVYCLAVGLVVYHKPR